MGIVTKIHDYLTFFLIRISNIMRKTKAKSQKTRQHLLNAALEVFHKQGVTRATLQEIAQEAGVTRGALYWHFKNKEDLFKALFEQVFQDCHLSLDEPLAEIDDAWVYLRQQLIHVFNNLSEYEWHRKFFNVVNMKCEHTPHNQTITALAEKYHQFFLARISQIVHLCHKQGKLPENIDLELAIIYLESSFVGVMRLAAFQPERFDLLSTAERTIDASMETLQTSAFLLKK